jgi:hypothetical protein
MIWAKRRLSSDEYIPYQEKFGPLMRAQKSRCHEFVMVAVDGDPTGAGEYYVGVPDELSLRLFDGFSRVNEDELPEAVDKVLVAGRTNAAVVTRFKLRRC